MIITKRHTSNTKFLIIIAAIVCVLLAVGAVWAFKYAGNTPKKTSAAEKSKNPLNGATFYLDPASRPAIQAKAWRTSQPKKAAAMDKLAALPVTHWLTEPSAATNLPSYMAAATAANQMPVLVSYYMPYRDCGQYSAGGAKTATEYKKFIDTIATAIGTTRTAVILEPDALSHLKAFDQKGKPCLQGDKQKTYYSLLSYAVGRLKELPATSVYIDAGNSMWVKDTHEVATHLAKVDIAKADGFSLNISNFQPTKDTIAYGEAISDDLQGKHFVIDTSRNGLGAYSNPKYPEQGWCNPPGRALGHFPTTDTGNDLVDAFLYIKRPGESDGTDPDPQKCFGGPKAGEWWPDYAVGLVDRWPKALQPVQ